MAELKPISADSHVNEPADLWLERIDKRFRDRAPRVVDDIPGRPPGSYLVLEGLPPVHLSQGLGAGKKPEELAGVLPGRHLQGCAPRRMGSGGAPQGHGHRRRRGGGHLHHARLPPVLADGRRPAARVLSRLQRLAGGVLLVRADAAGRALPHLAPRHRGRGGRSAPLAKDRPQGRDDLGVAPGGPVRTPIPSTIPSGPRPRISACRSVSTPSPAWARRARPCARWAARSSPSIAMSGR